MFLGTFFKERCAWRETEDFPPINVGTYVFVQPPKKHLTFFQVLAHSPAAGKKKEKNERNEDGGYLFCNHLSTFSAIQEIEFV